MATNSAPCKESLPPLLRLPPVIRRRIYRFVGLSSWDGRPQNFDLHGPVIRVPSYKYSWPFEATSPAAFHGLLLSCRDIYFEAAALLYSTNRFILRYTKPGSFGALFALSQPVLSCLTALRVVLNQASCHQRDQHRHDRDCCRTDYGRYICNCFHKHWHQRPLLSAGPEGGEDPSTATTQGLLSEWRAAASHLSAHITPDQLELGLVCDIDPRHESAVELANWALEPLHSFPRLRGCHIRLGGTRDPKLSQVAQNAVLRNCGPSAPYLRPTSADGRFMALPRELRLRILEFTDLVTPAREVWWSRQDPKYHWSDIGASSRCFDKAWPSRCNFLECGHGSRVQTGPTAGCWCFCHRRHAAYSTTCKCWIPPGPALFLVCRALRREAQLVFFSENRFVVHDLQLHPPWSLQPLDDTVDQGLEGFGRDYPYERLGNEYPYDRLAASQFLREVVPAHCIAHLRFLELVFLPYAPRTWPQTDHPAMRDWRETVGWLRDKINGPALTLRLVGADVEPDGPDPDTVTDAEGDKIHTAYMDLLQPLKGLAEGPSGLARFYADLPYPWQWTAEAISRQELDGWDWVQPKQRALKRAAERRVLGDRHVGQYANGKEEPECCLWQHVFYHHFAGY